MLKIAVCDDDNGELSHVKALLEQYQSQKRIGMRIELFHSAMELMEALHSADYQLLLLDILMPGFTGIQAARELRGFDKETKIIFLTSSPEFAVESYQVDAFYYLLKPIRAEDLFPVLDRLLGQLRRAEGTLLLTLPSGVLRLPFSDIEVLEINSKRLLFYLTDGSIREIPGTLTQYEPQLLGREGFAKVHRSYLVNMEHIRQFQTSQLITYSGRTVPVSRLLSGAVRKEYLDYLFRKEDRQP